MNKFMIFGLKFNMNQTKSKIEKDVQDALNQQGGKGRVVFEYNPIDENEIEFTFYRNIKFDIEVGEFLTSPDCVLITGCDISAFEVDLLGKDNPLVHCFPMGEHWYVPDLDLISLYEQELKCCVNQKTKQINVKSDEKQVDVHIIFR